MKNNNKNKIIVLLVAVLLVFCFFIAQNLNSKQFKLVSISPSEGVDPSSFVILNFNKNIKNVDDIKKELNVNVDTYFNVSVNEKIIIISPPQNGFTGSVNFNFKQILSDDGAEINSLNVKIKYTKGAQTQSYDLGDLDFAQFPGLKKLSSVSNNNFSLSYEINNYDRPTILIYIKNAELLDNNTEDPIKEQRSLLLKKNQEAVDTINKELRELQPFLIDYSDEYQKNVLLNSVEDFNNKTISSLSGD